MIIFREVTPKNFLSFGENAPTFRLDKSPTTLITGKNGAGKSTIAEAICFALFGKSFRGINKPQLVNTTNQKGCLVELTFDKNENHYKIIRGIKPNIFKIELNGVELNEDANVGDFQKQLESVLCYDYSTFIKTQLIGNANYTPFMKLSIPDRRTFIDTLLNVGIYTDMAALNKKYITDWKSERAALDIRLEGSARIHDNATKAYAKIKSIGDDKLVELEENLKVALEKSESIIVPEKNIFQAKYPTAKANIEQMDLLIRKTEGLKNKAQETQDNIKNITGRISENEATIARNEAGEEKEILRTSDAKKATVVANRATIRKNSEEMSSLKTKMKIYSERMAFFKDHDSCEVCDQHIAGEHSQKIIDECKEKALPMVKEYRELETENKRLESEIVALEQDIKQIDADNAEVASHNRIVKMKKESNHQNLFAIKSLKAELQTLEALDAGDPSTFAEEIAKHKEKREEYRNQTVEDAEEKQRIADENTKIDRIAMEKAYADEAVSRIKKEIDDFNNRDDGKQFLEEIEKSKEEIDKLNVIDASLNRRKRIMDASSELLKDSGIKSSVVKMYIPILVKHANEYLEVMGAQYKLLLDESFNDTIKGRFKDEFTYNSLSQGQRQRVDLALMFACIKVAQLCAGIETNLLILDEVADSSMDYDGIVALFDIIGYSQHHKNVFCISHRVEVADKCRSMISLEFANGFSKIA